MDSIVHGVAKSKTRRSDFHFSLFTSTKKLARQGLLPWCWGSLGPALSSEAPATPTVGSS